MYTRMPPRRRRRRTGRYFAFFFMVGMLLAVCWFGYLKFIPNGQLIFPQYGFQHPIMVQGETASEGALLENEEILLPIDVLNTVLGPDKPIYYEEATGSIVMTTASKVLHLRTESLTATINQKPYKLTVAAEKKDGIVYVPITPVQELYGVKAEYAEHTGVVTLLLAGQSVQLAEAGKTKGSAIRTGPSIRKPMVEKVPQGETVRIWGEKQGWLYVQGPDGHPGYMAKPDAVLTRIEQVAAPQKDKPFVAWKTAGKPINLTWEAVYDVKPDPNKIGKLEGVNVVSPTWFELQDGKGTIKGKADPAYVRWAHSQGMQVWALFSNGFEPARTTAALANADTRFSMIQQLIAFAQLYDLQGINIDFENVATADKANLVQFVKELTPLLHEQGLVVSIDVTPKSTSEMWSLFLDRKALGKAVDYMMVMAYDEHWASSPTSGSVASLSWTEQSLARIIQEDEVPPDKLILSMPLYTRIWTEVKDAKGGIKVSSKPAGMDKVKNIIADKKLKPVFNEETGQNYVEYTENGSLNRIWIEDDTSIKARIAIAHKYGIAGVATWQRNFQTQSIWNTINQALHNP
ncbi:glycosyl hydrolase family 18 protein [Paenibacillus protaetiae]|nr:glycosyl hydrolase family 18 protein [Paenibacillus protaetiae]